jgi:O-antigen ligase
LRRQFGLLIRTFLLLIPVVALSWTMLPAESKAYSTDFKPTLKGSVGTRITNAAVALSYFEKSPITGAGVGLRKMYDATNLFLFTLAETGILGLAAFLSIHLVFLRMAGSARRYLTPADPAFSFLVIGTALLIGKLVHGQVDHYWSRGQVLMAWAGAGMAVWAYFESRAVRPYRSLQDGQS